MPIALYGKRKWRFLPNYLGSYPFLESVEIVVAFNIPV
jgi:hypothetical protein